ncbi:ATP-dependent Clp protease proteolytic subunit [Acetobacterium wieringae]|uniref:head maturation protease, ClpP-related n=1 Tax=Acetobacterium wieringae TaxID=52694 RepID=UPI001D4E4EB8|nr:head maturation protease, ClpP-related [Acetobacterium wieringae]VUZ26514.1 ATP-dependent Clp protease proteolytic subunit [Acetobacterium wieringae]
MAIKKYYSLAKNGNTADIYIYGDITSWPWVESDVSSYGLAKELELLEAEQINCYINSYGGEVAEGLAIYNQLKRHPAKVTTICDGFACSAASVIFMAGDERLMGEASLLMIHNAWTYTSGNSEELRKQADDLDTITQASINAYLSCVNIEEAALKQLLDEETWILPADAVAMAFATGISEEEPGLQASQSVKQKVIETLAKKPGGPVFKIDLSGNVKQVIDDMKKEMQEQLDEIKKQACRSNVPETTENVQETDGKVPEQQGEESNLLKNLVAALSQKG